MNTKLKYLPIVISALILAGTVFGLGRPGGVSSAPIGAAQNLQPYSQSCLLNGSVLTRFSWAPSGLGTQWFDISAINNGFSSSFLNAGPLVAGHNQLDWYQLVANTRYYVRVNTFTSLGWLASDTITFVTPSCPGAGGEPAENVRVSSQSCLDNGSVLTSFAWNPSNDGTQWFDISALNNNFAFGFLNAGPLASNHNSLDWYQLVANTRYYVRVNTLTPIGWLPSSTLTFVTPSCGNFTPPTDPDATVLGPTTVKFNWDRGTNNVWFCVDTATSEAHLIGLTGSFMNHGCGVTAETFTSNAVPCGVKQWFRIFGVGAAGSGYSPIGTFTTPACTTFSPPTNLDESIIDGNVRFEWDKGTDNLWFCVETATSQIDLTSEANTWQTWGCGTTNEFLEVPLIDPGESGGLVCPESYYWRVFARGTTTSGVSAITTVQTGPTCP